MTALLHFSGSPRPFDYRILLPFVDYPSFFWVQREPHIFVIVGVAILVVAGVSLCLSGFFTSTDSRS